MSLSKKQDESRGNCDWCQGRKTRNQQIVHQLSFRDSEAFRLHLLSQFPDDKSGWIDSRLKWYRFVDYWHSAEARSKYQPLWLAYFESSGIKVNRRAEAIMKYRSRIPLTSTRQRE